MHRDGGRIVVVFGVGPSKEPRPVVHFPALDGGVGAICKRHINIEQGPVQALFILVMLADG